MESLVKEYYSLIISRSIHVKKATAPHSSTLACKIPWTEEPGRLHSVGSWRVGHDWVTSLSLFSFMHWRRKWQPTPVFLPGESQGRGSLVGCVYGVAQIRTWLKQLSSSSVAMKRREAKSKGEKERYKHLNAEFQRIARRDKKSLPQRSMQRNRKKQ